MILNKVRPVLRAHLNVPAFFFESVLLTLDLRASWSRKKGHDAIAT